MNKLKNNKSKINNDINQNTEEVKNIHKFKYIYLAITKDGKIAFDENNEPIFSSIMQEGASAKWDTNGKVVKGLILDKKYRIEVKNSNSKDERKEYQNKLCEKFKDKILADKNDVEKVNMTTDICDMGKNLIEKIEDMKNLILNESKQFQNSLEKDIANDCDDLINTIDKKISQLKNNIENAENQILKEQKNISQKNIESFEKSIKEVIKILKFNAKQNSAKEKLLQKVKDICETTETIEGNIHKLDKIDDIMTILSEKGIEVNREIPPISNEEEDIINLVRYSKKITEQLGYAARDLIRKKVDYEIKKQNIENEERILEEKKKDAYNEGVRDGKKYVIKALLDKYVEIDNIISSKNSYLKSIWACLKEIGVEIDGNGEYKKGKNINLTEEEAEKMVATYKKIDGAGKYDVLKTGLKFEDEIVFKAEFEKNVSKYDTEINKQKQIEEIKLTEGIKSN